MLNTEVREYVSQMNQDELKEVEQIIIESKVRKAIEEMATEQQLKCIKTDRNFVINQMERGMGKSWGIGLEILYRMENCIIKKQTKEQHAYFLSTMNNLVNHVNEKIGSEFIFIKSDYDKTTIDIGNKYFIVSRFNMATKRKEGYNTLYCDDCVPFSTDESYKKVVSYISEKDVRKLMTQCCFNDFMGQSNMLMIPKTDLYIDAGHDDCMLYYDGIVEKYNKNDYPELDLAHVVVGLLRYKVDNHNIYVDRNGFGMHFINVLNDNGIKYTVTEFKHGIRPNK